MARSRRTVQQKADRQLIAGWGGGGWGLGGGGWGAAAVRGQIGLHRPKQRCQIADHIKDCSTMTGRGGRTHACTLQKLEDNRRERESCKTTECSQSSYNSVTQMAVTVTLTSAVAEGRVAVSKKNSGLLTVWTSE